MDLPGGGRVLIVVFEGTEAVARKLQREGTLLAVNVYEKGKNV